MIPEGLLVEQVLPGPDRVVILCRPKSVTSLCPFCGAASARVHSHYQRTLADLPWQGHIVALRVQARRFRCTTHECQRRIFAERLPEVAVPRARRTGRLAEIQRHIGLALGGEAGSRLARRLTMPVGATRKRRRRSPKDLVRSDPPPPVASAGPASGSGCPGRPSSPPRSLPCGGTRD